MTSISRRLTLMNLLVSASALLLASTGFLLYDQFTFRQNLVRSLSAEAEIVGANSASALMFNDPQSAERTLEPLKAFPNIRAAGIYTPDGRVFARFSGAQAAIPQVPEGRVEIAEFSSDEVVVVRQIVFQGKTLGSVFIRSNLSELSHRLSRYLLIAGIVLLISLLAAWLISSRYRESIAGPVVSLAKTARAVSEEKNYSLRAKPTNDATETGMLVNAFNEMLQQIQSRDEALREAHDELEARVVERTRQLLVANRELEAFSYSVSHDLRGPLETINGYVHLIITKPGVNLDADTRESLGQVQAAARRMAELIDDLLNLSRVTTTAMHVERVDLSALALSVAQDLKRRDPARQIDFVIRDHSPAQGDPRLLQIVLENLLRNSWKYTSGREHAVVEFGYERRANADVFFVRDNGVGFDPTQAERLFKPFQRLHSEAEFPGTGVGLATVQRIIERHGGDIWAQSKPGQG
ncbi:MAG TPA: ATP-binding protein, partial [Candidatus Limnocylindrales bacterium]|nr:ATP-binding protein [Candidatus Limnocylindrales bacterium]